MARRRRVPGRADGRGAEHVERLEQRTGKRFGDQHDPLLVSVRSGAAISMPGMMDTILNVGLSDVAVQGLAASTGNPRFAYDSYRRLIQMYGETVDGVDPHRFESELQKLKEARGVSHDVDLTPTTSPRSSTRSRRSTSTTSGSRSRRTRASSSAARSRLSSRRGTRRGRRSTGARTRSPTTSAPP